MDNIKFIDFLGLKISIFENEELKSFIKNSIAKNQKKVLFGYSLGSFPYFKKHPEMAVYSNQFDVSVTDGRGLYLFAKALGYPVKSDISIPNMSKMTLEMANEFKYSVMMIGSTPENNLKATENTRKKYPDAVIYDGYDGGFFTQEDQLVTANKINACKPDILFIGVSSPKKEAFAVNWKDKLDVKIIIPFGGAIDILSGKSKPIPKVVKKMCLGAIYRFIQEPRRLFRDSILYTSSVVFRLFPIILFKVKILGDKHFSIPKYYSKDIDAPIV